MPRRDNEINISINQASRGTGQERIRITWVYAFLSHLPDWLNLGIAVVGVLRRRWGEACDIPTRYVVYCAMMKRGWQLEFARRFAMKLGRADMGSVCLDV